MIWAGFALLACWLYCAHSEVNKHYKIDGFRLNTCRSALSAFFLLPVLPFMEWPAIPSYYLVVMAEAGISVICMKLQYDLASRRNGRVSCLHQPVTIILVFMAWILLDEGQQQFLMDNPLNALGIAAAFIIFIVAINAIRKSDISLEVLYVVIPIAVLYAAMTVISKLALEQGDTFFGVSMNFVFLTNIAMFILSYPILKKRTFLGDKKLFQAGSMTAAFHTLSWIFICAALILTPNPAYPSIITGTAPLWFLLYYKAIGFKDDASPVAGIFMGLAAILILIFSG